MVTPHLSSTPLTGSRVDLRMPSMIPSGGRGPLRVLIVAHLDRLASRLDRNQYYRYAALARQPGVTLFGPGIPGYRPEMSIAEAVSFACEGAEPDVILHGLDVKESGVPLVSGLSETNAVTAIELQDSWAVPELQAKFISEQQFDLALIIVRHHIPFYRERCPRTEFLWTPHAVNTSLFHDYGLPKRYDVLLYGAMHEHTYPLRARLAAILSSSALNVRWIKHPGYYPYEKGHDQDVITGSDLSREINQAWITVATSSIYRCVMMKYYETAASNSLIAGDMPDEGREIFGNNFLKLSSEQSDRELLRAVTDCLADKPQLKVLAKAAHECVMRDFNTDAFAVRLLGQFQEFVSTRWRKVIN